MACATLKRSLDFDPLHHSPSNSPKRRRCMPMTLSPATPPSRQSSPSSFKGVVPKLTTEQIAANLAAEVKRMQRRRQLHYPQSSSPPPSGSATPPVCSSPSLDNTSNPVQSTAAPTSASHFNALSPTKKDMPLFTFRQVSMFCDRMLKEREEQITEQYDRVLSCKLAEQYEAFLKFNHDQLRRQFTNSTVSYVS